mgnify:CR=1 FL=1
MKFASSGWVSSVVQYKLLKINNLSYLLKIQFLVICFMLLFSPFFDCLMQANAAEPPPFRARWPIINMELEVGARGFNTFDENSNLDGASKERYGFGVGVNDWFFFEIEGEYEKEAGEKRKFTAYEIDTRYELTKTKGWNEKPNDIDIGISLGVSFPDNSKDAYEIESRLLLYKNFGVWRSTGNIILEQEFENSSDSGLEIAYAGQLRYRLTPNIQPGVEVFGRFGELDDIAIGNEQHQVGPGVFGFVEFDDNYGFKYELGWLFGYTDTTPDNTLKFLIEFEYKY